MGQVKGRGCQRGSSGRPLPCPGLGPQTMGQEEGGCAPGGEGGKSLLERFWKASEAPPEWPPWPWEGGPVPAAAPSRRATTEEGGSQWGAGGRGGFTPRLWGGRPAVSPGRSGRHQGAEAKAWGQPALLGRDGPFCPTATTLRSCRLPWRPTVLDTHMPPMVTVAQVRSEKAGTVSVAPLAGRM